MDQEMNSETLEKLRELKLYGMYNSFKASLDNYNRDYMTIDKFVNQMVNSEWDDRYNRSVDRMIKLAGFRYAASIEELDYSHERGFDRNMIERLASLTFIDEKKDILITGCAGTGKTYIATALGYCACLKGLKVVYEGTSKILGQLKLSQANGNIMKVMKKYERADLLIMDDFLLNKMDNIERKLLAEVIDSRHKTRSTIFASQIPVSSWHSQIGEATVADAIMDRIGHKSIRIDLIGDSMRKKY